MSPAKIFAMAHHAGGVGKTTSTLNLGYELASLGQRVCLVDLDPQADLSDRLKLEPIAPTLAEALTTGKAIPTPITCTWKGISLDVIPGSLDMAGVEVALVGVMNGRERRLRQALTKLPIPYDFILIDCPPSLSVLTINAFYAAQAVIIPVQSQDKAYKAIPLVLSSIDDVGQYSDLEVFGFLITMTGRTNLEKEVAAAVAEDYPTLVFATTIPRLIEYVEDNRWSQPIGAYRPNGEGAAAYRRLAAEVLERVETRSHRETTRA